MFRNAEYLKFVRGHACCICGASSDHAHHYAKRHGGGGTSIKPHDSYTVPLCAAHHYDVHANGEAGGMSKNELDYFFFRTSLFLLTEWVERGGAR